MVNRSKTSKIATIANNNHALQVSIQLVSSQPSANLLLQGAYDTFHDLPNQLNNSQVHREVTKGYEVTLIADLSNYKINNHLGTRSELCRHGA